MSSFLQSIAMAIADSPNHCKLLVLCKIGQDSLSTLTIALICDHAKY